MASPNSPTAPSTKARPPPHTSHETTPLLPTATTHAYSAPNRELHGYALVALSCIGFSLMSLFVHIAEQRHNIAPPISVFIRAVIQVTLSTLYITLALPLRQTFALSKRQCLLLLYRGAAGGFGLLFYFTALSKLPVGDAVTIFFSAPVLVMLLCNLLLSEPITLTDGLAAAISFVGVFLMARPDGVHSAVSAHARLVGTLYALAAAALSSTTYVAIRSLGTTVHFMLSVLSMGVFCLLASVVMGGGVGVGVLANLKGGAALVVLSSLFAFGGTCAVNRGLQLCRAGPGALVRNLDVPIAYLLGIFFLSEAPTRIRLFASALVCLAPVIIGLRQLLQKRGDGC